MAPEQLISPNSVDHRADIFSLGVVFYEMLTGELPMGRFAPPSEKSLANQQIDQRIDEVVLRALAKERELRQQSAGEMKTDVETISATPRCSSARSPVPAIGSTRQSFGASGATGGSFEPPVNSMNTGEQSPPPVALGATRSIRLVRRWRMLLAVSAAAGALVVLDATRMLLERWSDRSPAAIAPPVDEHEVVSANNSFGDDHGTDVSDSRTSGRVSYRNDSAAETEAKRLGLIRVVDAASDVYVVQQPIGLKGDTGEVFVEPHFSALVRLPHSTNKLSLSLKEKLPLQANAGERFNRVWTVAYPCDYMACDWTAGTDNPHFMGYLLSPGAYDFRGDAETAKRLNEVDSSQLAKIAAETLRLIAEATSKSAATESDWQQATHLRFKFVPKSISKLNVPDECLVVLTDDSRTVFTREGGRFTKYELAAAEPIRELRDGIGKAVSANLEADVKLLLDKAHRAVKQQNWEELLTCLTDDGRDEWIFEITTGSSLVMTVLEKQGGVAVLKSIPQMATLTQLGDELKKLLREPTTEEGKLLDQRYQNYSKLSAADRRQLRIDVMRASYPDMARVATTTLTFVRQPDEKKPIIDFSTVTDLLVEGDRATGTWSKIDGKLNPIVIRRVEANGKRIWKIDSLIGKSVIEPPFPVFAFPAGLIPRTRRTRRIRFARRRSRRCVYPRERAG